MMFKFIQRLLRVALNTYLNSVNFLFDRALNPLIDRTSDALFEGIVFVYSTASSIATPCLDFVLIKYYQTLLSLQDESVFSGNENFILREACRKGQTQFVKALLTFKSVRDDIAVCDTEVLYLAVQSGAIEMVEDLLKYPEIVNSVACKNNRAYRYTFESTEERIRTMLNHEMIDVLYKIKSFSSLSFLAALKTIRQSVSIFYNLISFLKHCEKMKKIRALLIQFPDVARELSSDITEWDENSLIKKFGHELGLNGSEFLSRQPGDLPEYEGLRSTSMMGYIIIQRMITLFIDKLSNYGVPAHYSHLESDLKRYFKMISFVIDTLAIQAKYNILDGKNNDLYLRNVADAMMLEYGEGNPIILNGGFEGHYISLVLYKKYLIVSNRGAAAQMGIGCHIFEIHSTVDEQVIKDFLVNVMALREQPKEVFEKEFGHYINFLVLDQSYVQGEPYYDIKTVDGLPAMWQRHGTCALVNLQRTIEGLLYLFEWERREERVSKSELRNYARSAYKEISLFRRNQSASDLIELINCSTGDKYQCLIRIAKNVIEQHHGAFKDEDEIARAVKLFNALPSEVKDEIERGSPKAITHIRNFEKLDRRSNDTVLPDHKYCGVGYRLACALQKDSISTPGSDDALPFNHFDNSKKRKREEDDARHTKMAKKTA